MRHAWFTRKGARRNPGGPERDPIGRHRRRLREWCLVGDKHDDTGDDLVLWPKGSDPCVVIQPRLQKYQHAIALQAEEKLLKPRASECGGRDAQPDLIPGAFGSLFWAGDHPCPIEALVARASQHSESMEIKAPTSGLSVLRPDEEGDVRTTTRQVVPKGLPYSTSPDEQGLQGLALVGWELLAQRRPVLQQDGWSTLNDTAGIAKDPLNVTEGPVDPL